MIVGFIGLMIGKMRGGRTFPKVVAMIHMPSLPMLAIIAVFAVLLLGKRLPALGRNVARGISEFKKGLKDVDDKISLR